MLLLDVAFVLSAAALVYGQTDVAPPDIVSDCPRPDGFFADAEQCDRYYKCEENVLSEHLCEDGLVFNDLQTKEASCDYPFTLNCEGRPTRQTPKGTGNCPRKNGYFTHPDESVCNVFYYCTNDIDYETTCPEGLYFSLKTGTCVWPDSSGRTGCINPNTDSFTCPSEPLPIARTHPLYADETDCQFFYVCISGKNPRRNGCTFGKVYNPEIKSCDDPKNVPLCADKYKKFFDEYYATGGESSQLSQGEVMSAAIASNYPIPEINTRVRLQPGTIIRRRRPVEDSLPTQEQAEPRPAARPRPFVEETLPSDEPTLTDKPSKPKTPKPNRKRPLRRRRPIVPGRNRFRPRTSSTTTTTTTTTTTEAPTYDEAYDDYYYYDYLPGDEAATAPAK